MSKKGFTLIELLVVIA
ncbi:MAG: prepilin-type N-terminal cleavage/methylation domain-containing protein, partial [bacterium]|nr:prepilin-type N-terminal cleavage/methylation domain-containing protein [bacterium]